MAAWPTVIHPTIGHETCKDRPEMKSAHSNILTTAGKSPQARIEPVWLKPYSKGSPTVGRIMGLRYDQKIW